MQFDIITLFPEMFDALNYGIIHRALEQKIITVSFWNPRDFTHDIHKSVDDRPYGGGPGMIMLYKPLHDAICAAKKSNATPATVIHLSPQGKPLTQKIIRALSEKQNRRFILVSSRYEGIDERLLKTDIDAEYSIGDYVLSGGELPAMVLIDSITRLLPNVLNDPESTKQDSFSNSDGLLDYPHYTRPATIDALSVPLVLQSGNHDEIQKWRHQESIRNTWQKRPDLLKRLTLTEDDQNFLKKLIEKSSK
ncbi:MAG: tRNA (guanine-N(1)-)-methyltransferase [uncultured bacterium]|nr:MAG: tRNA (guanine-N(1)-)-methyltransferase [uncultured bacterium]